MTRFAVIALVIAGFACDRERRPTRGTPPASLAATLVGQPLKAGPASVGSDSSHARGPYPYAANAWAMAEGKSLYNAFNCVGCHAQGGGGMGPALMDSVWIYGASPDSIYQTIVRGRPNGMPSFRGRLPEDRIWQLVAYVRSMSGLERFDARPGRSEHMYARQPDNRTRRDEHDPARQP